MAAMHQEKEPFWPIVTGSAPRAVRETEYGRRHGLKKSGSENLPVDATAIARRRPPAPSCCTCAHAMLAKPRF